METPDHIDAMAGWMAAGPRDGFLGAERFLTGMGLTAPGAQALAFGLSVAVFALILGVMARRASARAARGGAPVPVRAPAVRAARTASRLTSPRA